MISGSKISLSRTLAAGIASLTFGLAMVSLPSACRAQQSGSFGSVDTNKIQSGYTKKADLTKSLQDLNDSLVAAAKVEAQSDMLSGDQQKKLSDLLLKPGQTDADRAAIAALQSQSRNDAAELASLQQKQNPSDTEKARLDVLTKEQQAGRAALEQMNSDYSDRLQQQQNKVSQQFTDLVRQAVAAVAKEKGLSVVFDSSVAIWSANDITDDVLKRINK